MAAERSYPKSEARGVAERSYHTSKVRGSGREYQTVTAQERLRGATQHLRSGSVAGRSYLTPPSPRSGAAAGRSYPTSKELWLRGRRRAYPTLKVRKGGGEEIPLVQGKEQWLCFAGAAVKRYPTPKVRETQVRR